MNDIPVLAWIAIAGIVVITVLINIGMVVVLRNPSRLRKIKMPRGQKSGLDMQKAVNTLRDPFRDEREQLNELSTLVHGLDASPAESHEMKEDSTGGAKKARSSNV